MAKECFGQTEVEIKKKENVEFIRTEKEII